MLRVDNDLFCFVGIAIFVGLIFNLTNLVWIGVFFFGLMVLFSLLTLSVEIDASRHGLRLLDEAELLQTDEDATGARKVLTAAAITSVLRLLYYISDAKINS